MARKGLLKGICIFLLIVYFYYLMYLMLFGYAHSFRYNYVDPSKEGGKEEIRGVGIHGMPIIY